MSVCSFCGETATEALSIRHFGCNHMTHGDCMPAEPTMLQSEKCCQCLGESANVNLADRLSLSISKKIPREPRLNDGRDYMLHPGTRSTNVVVSAFSAVASLIPGRAPETVETTRNCIFLLNNHVPIGDMMRVNEVGLDHILQSGLTIDDFLKNHYTWDDLLKFEDVGNKGPTRALQTLCIGMRANANHFRDYPDAFPYERVRAHTKMEKGDLCQYFGLTFPHNGPLECRGDQGWNAAQCVKLGLNFNDLIDFGLRYVEQYSDLIFNMTPHQVQQAEQFMGVTPARIAELVCLQDQVAEQHEEVALQQRDQVAAVVKLNNQQPVYVPFVQPQPPPTAVYYKPQQQQPVRRFEVLPAQTQLIHQPKRGPPGGPTRIQQQQQHQLQDQEPYELPKMAYKSHGARAAARHGFLQ